LWLLSLRVSAAADEDHQLARVLSAIEDADLVLDSRH